MATKRRYREKGSAMPARSIRIPDEIWEKAKWRAGTKDHVTLSHVIYTLLEGYALGKVHLPRVEVIYEQEEPVESTVA